MMESIMALPLIEQSIRKQAAAIVTSGGTVDILFEYIPEGQTWQGTISVQTPGAGGVWIAKISGQPLGQWNGGASFGPIQVGSSEQLEITGTGLVPGTQVIATLIGMATTGTPQQIVYPNPLAQTVSSTRPSLALTTIVAPNGVQSAVNSITLDPGVRAVTLIPTISAAVIGALNVTIVGNTTGFVYATTQIANNVVGGGQVNSIGRFPLNPSIDPSVTITISKDIGSTNGVITVYVELEYDPIVVEIVPSPNQAPQTGLIVKPQVSTRSGQYVTSGNVSNANVQIISGTTTPILEWMLYNPGPAIAWLSFGASGNPAGSGIPVLPNQQYICDRWDFYSAIGAAPANALWIITSSVIAQSWYFNGFFT